MKMIKKGVGAMKVKFKPVYRYQSAEFEIDLNETDLDMAMVMYSSILTAIKNVADEVCPEEGQPRTSSKKDEPKPELATDKQKAIMIKYGIPYNTRTTKAEARELINKSLSQM